MPTQIAKIHTIPLGLPFAKTLANGLLDSYQDNLLGLSDVHLYLPNRQACRVVRQAFLKASDGRATILPRMIPLGDIDEDDIFDSDPFVLNHDRDIPSAISPLERQMILTELLLARNDILLTTAQAFTLAGDLGTMIDHAHSAHVELTKLDSLVTQDIAEHWQKTLQFLGIIKDVWPTILQEREQCDPGKRRSLLLRKMNQALKKQQPKQPIIAAANTGTTHDTRQLLHTISMLPQGCIILDGFNSEYPIDYWENIDATHPYYFSKKLLDMAEYQPKNVTIWPSIQKDCDLSVIAPRVRTIHHALQPASHYSLIIDSLIDQPKNISLVSASNLHDEAGTIAMILRQLIEEKDQSIMVVTPDRKLAKQISSLMQRWEINVPNLGDVPIIQTVVGQFLSNILHLHGSTRPASHLLDILRHPLFHACSDTLQQDAYINAIDIQLRQSLSLEKIYHFVPIEVIEGLQAFYTTTITHLLFGNDIALYTLDIWIDKHLYAAEALTGSAENLWSAQSGEEIVSQIIALKQTNQATQLEMTLLEYQDFFVEFFSRASLRSIHEDNQNIRLVSPHESHLQDADVVIMAGLNEKIWPPQQPSDPWLSRKMRQEMGFGDIEARIGQMALGFQNHFCAPRVILTWSAENDAGPALPSRWLQQCFAVWEKNDISIDTMQHTLEGAYKFLDRPEKLTPRPAPAPQPPIDARPKELHVTHIGIWYNDPYSLYVKKILQLEPSEPLDKKPGSAEWGNIIHNIISTYMLLPSDRKNIVSFYQIGCDMFEELSLPSLKKQRWKDQLYRLGERFILYMNHNKGQYYSEIQGQINCTVEHVKITIKGRADFIITMHDSTKIIDFKTGQVPSGQSIIHHRSPQLPLLGLILQNKGFHDITIRPSTELQYLQINGKIKNDFKEISLKKPNEIIDNHFHHLRHWIQRFYINGEPYHAYSLPASQYDTYAHLKRSAEWSVYQDIEDEEDSESDQQ